jgi:hypothetical protein
MNPEDLLSETLRDRVDRTDYPSTPLAAVSTRARTIRSRRRGRTTVVAAAAAVAVVAVPGAVWLGRSPGSSIGPSDAPSSTTSSPTVSTSEPPVMALNAIPQGSRPGIDYLVGDTYVAMGGGRTTSPAFSGALTAALGRAGILVATPRAGSTPADLWLVSNGQRQALGCGSGRFAITPDRVESAYWLADSCADPGAGGKLYSGVDNTMGQSGPGYERFQNSGLVDPVGFVRQGVVVNADPSAGPEVIVMGVDHALAALTSAAGADDNNNVVSGVLAGNDQRSGVVDAATDSVLWSTDPGWELGQFSTDGRYVAGIERQSGSTTYAIFDARTGNQVTTLDPLAAGLRIDQLAWDEQNSLLAVADTGQEQAIVRYDLNGHPTLATPVRTVASPTDGFRLATRP